MAEPQKPTHEDISSTEFTDDNGVTVPVRMVREAVPPEVDGVDLLWHGEKHTTSRLTGTSVHQGASVSLNVPPQDDPDYVPLHPGGNEKVETHDTGHTYVFRRGKATRVHPKHAQWLLDHPVLRFEKVESTAEKAKRELEDEKAKQRQREADERERRSEVQRASEAPNKKK